MANLQGRDLLSLRTYTQDEIYHLLSKAIELKRQLKSKHQHRLLKGKTIAMLFEKPSARTRISCETACAHLGIHPIFIRPDEVQIGVREPIKDIARVLGGYVDAIIVRTFAQDNVDELAEHTAIPVINALTDEYHPLQALADMMTILEIKDRLAGLKLAYIGDGNNVAHSLLIAGSKLGVNVTIGCPKGYEPAREIVEFAQNQARVANQTINVLEDPVEAAAGADIVYSDVWASMGQEDERAIRLEAFEQYQVNRKLMQAAKQSAIFMHCLPAHRGEEVTDEVMESKQSVVFEQAENRMHTTKAVLLSLIG